MAWIFDSTARPHGNVFDWPTEMNTANHIVIRNAYESSLLGVLNFKQSHLLLQQKICILHMSWVDTDDWWWYRIRVALLAKSWSCFVPVIEFDWPIFLGWYFLQQTLTTMASWTRTISNAWLCVPASSKAKANAIQPNCLNINTSCAASGTKSPTWLISIR